MVKKIILASIAIVTVLLVYTQINTAQNNEIKENRVDKNLLKLKLAHNLPEDSALHEASLLLSQQLKHKSNGQISLEIFPKQILGNDYKMVELARNGEIDILLTPTAKMSVSVPSMQYADLPFLFPTREDAYTLLDGEVGQMLLDDLQNIGLIGVAFWENGFKHFTGNKPLLSPDDFIDSKIRVMKSRIIMEQFNALDAKPIPIDFHSTKQALADKVVDGQENPLVAIVNMGFHKVQTDLTLSEHAYLPYVVSISKKAMSRLSIDEQDMLINTIKGITAWEREETQNREEKFLQTISQSGVTIHNLNVEQKEAFAQKTKYIQKMFEETIGSHIISKTEEVLYSKYKNDNSVAIGLDADLSMHSKASGLAIKRGIELALDEINNSGGLLGKKVVLIAKDHKAISTKGVKNINELVNGFKVKAIIGGKHSAIVASEIETIQKAKVPFISPWAASSKIVDNGYKDNYIFRVSANDKFVAKKLINETLQNHQNPLVIVENSIWGRDGLSLLKEYASKKNINLLHSNIVNRGEKDFSNLLSIVKENKIDSILMIVNSNEGSMIVNTLFKNNIKLPIISHWGIVGDDFYKINQEFIDSMDLKFIQTFTFLNNYKNKVHSFANKYLHKYGLKNIHEINAPAAVAQAYDATHLLALAIKKANSFDGVKVKKALESLAHYDGLLKTYETPFSQTDHEALSIKDFYFATYDSKGLIVPLDKY